MSHNSLENYGQLFNFVMHTYPFEQKPIYSGRQPRMKRIENIRRHAYEIAIYAVLWCIILLAPVISLYLEALNDTGVSFSWTAVGRQWVGIVPFFALFLLHAVFLAPLLVWKQKRILYFVCTLGALTLFYFTQPEARPFDSVSEPRMEQPLFRQAPPPANRVAPNDSMNNRLRKELPPPRHDLRPFDPNRGPRPPFDITPPLLKLILALCMLALNLVIAYYFRLQIRERAMRELEKQNLKQELDYLKYQINPHFFMNTLNNIHALVDIDPELAKSTILELSKLMRFVLYEGSKSTIRLSREIEFLNHYISLMRLRYSDNVMIQVDLPHDVPGIEIPPLLFISFIENAFKHGISYQNESFINVSLTVEDHQITFECINSLHASTHQDSYSGIGLENIRKRLNLLYGTGYSLHTFINDSTYKVSLSIPVDYDQMPTH